jgi:aspartyl-tRNA(Asn)/glutamyl-tRNA(Gln) amidotransferase subunit A
VSVADWTLAEVAEAISARRVTSRAAVEACLARVATWQPRVNAFAALETERALAMADAVDRALDAGQPAGRLAGVPLAHKDMYFRRGRRSTLGSRAPPPAPEQSSTVLGRLEAEGAIELGTLNMAEFALGPTGHNAFLGDCRNPWQPAHVACGSSSGSGAAVAARTVFGSFGSDTGGSIRLPASATGVVGLKPTHGRVSRAGMMPLSSSVDVPGIVARTARDAALLLQVAAGHDPRDSAVSARPVPDYIVALDGGVPALRVGIPENHFLEQVSADVARALDASRDVLTGLGAVVVPVRIPWPEPLCELSRAIVYSEVAALHATWLRRHFRDYSPQVRMRVATGFAIPAPVYLQALRLRPVLLGEFVREVFKACDVLHLPTLGIPVPTLAESDVGGAEVMWEKIALLVRCTAPFNYLGLPALSVPCGFTDNGLPTSFQLVGRPFAEATLLRVAHAFQGATDWHRRAPVPQG